MWGGIFYDYCKSMDGRMSCSLNLRNVSYTNEHKALFANVCLNVGHEEKIAILGANGCGKSTLLKIMAGLIKPSSGYVEIFHHKMENLKAFNTYRNDIGYLPQDVSNHFLCPTVIEDVIFSLRANGVTQNEAIKKADILLEELGIIHLKQRTVFELSGGEQKIVALAGLLILEPKILLLDEPTNALDAQSQERIMSLLKSINKSMVIVSHHHSFIENLAHNMYELKESCFSKIE
jgi:cobalt/nickel transport system ATP-binding protein